MLINQAQAWLKPSQVAAQNAESPCCNWARYSAMPKDKKLPETIILQMESSKENK